MLLILAILGYALLALLGLILVVLAVVMLSPIRFRANGSFSAELVGGDAEPSGMFWLAALDPDLDLDDLSDDGDEEPRVAVAATGTGGAVLLWGLLEISDDGVRMLGRRLGGRTNSADRALGRARRGRTRGERQADRAAQTSRNTGTTKALPTVTGSDAQSKQGKAPRVTSYISLRGIRRLLPIIGRSLGLTWAALRLRMRLYVTLGLEDPVITGLLAGMVPAVVEPVIWRTNSRRPGSITYFLCPVFDREVMAADFTLAGHTTIAGLTWPLIRLVLHRDVRRMWWRQWRNQRLAKRQGGTHTSVIHW